MTRDILHQTLTDLGISEWLTRYATSSDQTIRTCDILLRGSFESDRVSVTWDPKTAVEIYLKEHSNRGYGGQRSIQSPALDRTRQYILGDDFPV